MKLDGNARVYGLKVPQTFEAAETPTFGNQDKRAQLRTVSRTHGTVSAVSARWVRARPALS